MTMAHYLSLLLHVQRLKVVQTVKAHEMSDGLLHAQVELSAAQLDQSMRIFPEPESE